MENNTHAMKKRRLIFIPIGLLPVAILFIFDTRLWLSARDLIPPDYYFIAKLITNWGLYLFYAIFLALFVTSFVRKNRKLTNLCLAYLKAQLIVSFAAVRFLKIVLGRARPGHGAEFTLFSLNSRLQLISLGTRDGCLRIRSVSLLSVKTVKIYPLSLFAVNLCLSDCRLQSVCQRSLSIRCCGWNVYRYTGSMVFRVQAL